MPPKKTAARPRTAKVKKSPNGTPIWDQMIVDFPDPTEPLKKTRTQIEALMTWEPGSDELVPNEG